MSNWGRGELIPDLTPDDDSIVIAVHFTVSESTKGKEVEVKHTLKAGVDLEVTGNYAVELKERSNLPDKVTPWQVR